MWEGPSSADNSLGALETGVSLAGRINYEKKVSEPAREIPTTPL